MQGLNNFMNVTARLDTHSATCKHYECPKSYVLSKDVEEANGMCHLLSQREHFVSVSLVERII